MAFYCTKKVKGHLYAYLQESHRDEAGRVYTKSTYLGPVAGGLPLGKVETDRIRAAKGVKPRTKLAELRKGAEPLAKLSEKQRAIRKGFVGKGFSI